MKENEKRWTDGRVGGQTEGGQVKRSVSGRHGKAGVHMFSVVHSAFLCVWNFLQQNVRNQKKMKGKSLVRRACVCVV